MYYILQQDPRVPGQAHVMTCPPNLNLEDWIDGTKLPDPGPLHLKMAPTSGAFRGDIIGGVLTLFHKMLVEELARLGVDNLQVFPVDLEAPSGKVNTNYSLINVLDLVEAVDEARSVIKPRATGGRGQLYSFNIDPVKAGGRRLFRLAEAPTLIIIDEALQESLLAFQPAGAWMLDTDRYDGWG